MSENDFYMLNGNSYRGSRYANFTGAGVDTQGNVSTATNENEQNNLAQTPSAQPTPQVANEVREVSNRGIDLSPTDVKAQAAPQGLTKQAMNMAIGGIVPSGTATIGGQIGANIASGAPAFGNMGSAIGNRISAGLLGSSASSSATNAALAGMGGKFGPATQAAVGQAAAGGTIGSALGTGFGSAAATLLTGGSVKDAAISGLGSAAGYAIGSAIGMPMLGSVIGSVISNFAGKLFGGKPGRIIAGARLEPDDQGQLQVGFVGNKRSSDDVARTYGTGVADILNRFGSALGLKYTTPVYTETVGVRDVGTYLGNRVSTNQGDIGAVALQYLKTPEWYTMGDDGALNEFWQKEVSKATDLTSLGNSVDDYFLSRNLIASPGASTQARMAQRQGDKFATFFG